MSQANEFGCIVGQRERVVQYAVATAMVWKSRGKGIYEDYQQYDTIRKLRSAYSSVYGCSFYLAAKYV